MGVYPFSPAPYPSLRFSPSNLATLSPSRLTQDKMGLITWSNWTFGMFTLTNKPMKKVHSPTPLGTRWQGALGLEHHKEMRSVWVLKRAHVCLTGSRRCSFRISLGAWCCLHKRLVSPMAWEGSLPRVIEFDDNKRIVMTWLPAAFSSKSLPERKTL